MPAATDTVRADEAPLIFVVGARGVPDVEGGAEKNAEMLFPLVAANGYRVTLVGLADNIKSRDVQGRPPDEGAALARPEDRQATLLCDGDLHGAAACSPRIVHFQGLGSALFLWAYKLMGAKTVVRYGSADYLVGKWGMLGKLGFLLSEFQLRFADAVISVTPALAERLARRGIKAQCPCYRQRRRSVAGRTPARTQPVATTC